MLLMTSGPLLRVIGAARLRPLRSVNTAVGKIPTCRSDGYGKTNECGEVSVATKPSGHIRAPRHFYARHLLFDLATRYTEIESSVARGTADDS